MLTLCLIYRGRLAILLGGCQYHAGEQSGHVVRHGYCDDAQVAEPIPRHARLSVEMPTDTIFVILTGRPK